MNQQISLDDVIASDRQLYKRFLRLVAIRAEIDAELARLPWANGRPWQMPGVTMNSDARFDFVLTGARIREHKLAGLLADSGKVELKTEQDVWRKTGHLCIEYRNNGLPAGLAVTEAAAWVHELQWHGKTLVYLCFPVARIRELAADAWRKMQFAFAAGRNRNNDCVLVKLRDMLLP